MKMPYYVAHKTHLTEMADRIDDAMAADKYSPRLRKQGTQAWFTYGAVIPRANRHMRRFYNAFIKKCSAKFGGQKGK